jgi:hypothetical protein
MEEIVQLLDRNWQLGKYNMKKMEELDLDFCWNNLKHDGDHIYVVEYTLPLGTLQMVGRFDCSAVRGSGEN